MHNRYVGILPEISGSGNEPDLYRLKLETAQFNSLTLYLQGPNNRIDNQALLIFFKLNEFTFLLLCIVRAESKTMC